MNNSCLKIGLLVKLTLLLLVVLDKCFHIHQRGAVISWGNEKAGLSYQLNAPPRTTTVAEDLLKADISSLI